jgi:hypothetical protein
MAKRNPLTEGMPSPSVAWHQPKINADESNPGFGRSKTQVRLIAPHLPKQQKIFRTGVTSKAKDY